MIFKILNGQTPDNLSDKFIFRNDTTSFRLRNSEMRLALPQLRTDYVRKSFSYSCAALWNSLPTDISAPNPDRAVLVRVKAADVAFLGKTLFSISASFHPSV